MRLLIVPALLALGFVIRDGLGDLRSLTDGKLGTQAARAFGGIFVLAGSLCAMPSWWGAGVGIALTAGFWTDFRHGAGQQARDWRDARDLAISGVTSLLPAAAVIWAHDSRMALALIVCGLIAKPAIWFMAWRMAPNFLPTRISAVAFGLLTGLVILPQ